MRLLKKFKSFFDKNSIQELDFKQVYDFCEDVLLDLKDLDCVENIERYTNYNKFDKIDSDKLEIRFKISFNQQMVFVDGDDGIPVTTDLHTPEFEKFKSELKNVVYRLESEDLVVYFDDIKLKKGTNIDRIIPKDNDIWSSIKRDLFLVDSHYIFIRHISNKYERPNPDNVKDNY